MGILEKLTTRNAAAIGTIGTFLGLTSHVIVNNPTLLENPIVTGLLGVFTTVTVLIYQFYFRTSGPTA